MKKHLVTILLTIVCLMLFPSLAASADVLIEPENNNFYNDHSDECDYHGRSYYANGDSGEIRLVDAPGSLSEIARITNGDTVYIMFTYLDGDALWGVVDVSTPDLPLSEWPSGWVQMRELLPVYDYISFEEDHGDEFYVYPDVSTKEFQESVSDIVLWTWPGSGEILSTIRTIGLDGDLGISQAYNDEEGREWGFISYYQGYRNVWICLSDPANENIPAFNAASEPEPTQTDASQSADGVPATGDGSPDILLTVVLVTILIACTALLIRIYWKRRQIR